MASKVVSIEWVPVACPPHDVIAENLKTENLKTRKPENLKTCYTFVLNFVR